MFTIVVSNTSRLRKSNTLVMHCMGESKREGLGGGFLEFQEIPCCYVQYY